MACCGVAKNWYDSISVRLALAGPRVHTHTPYAFTLSQLTCHTCRFSICFAFAYNFIELMIGVFVLRFSLAWPLSIWKTMHSHWTADVRRQQQRQPNARPANSDSSFGDIELSKSAVCSCVRASGQMCAFVFMLVSCVLCMCSCGSSCCRVASCLCEGTEGSVLRYVRWFSCHSQRPDETEVLDEQFKNANSCVYCSMC